MSVGLLSGMSLTAYAEGTESNPILINTWSALYAELAKDRPSGEHGANPTYYRLTADVKAGANDSLIKVGSDRYVVLNMDGHTIDRNMASSAENGRVFNIYGNLNITGNGTITGGNNSGNGGGVWVSGGMFIMEGGTICKNKATGDSNGGGVFVQQNGRFIMKGGTIKDNTAKYGGGVYEANGCTFEMNGTISGNSAENDGGVFVNRGDSTTFNDKKGAFNMTAGSVTGNTAKRYGGGVCTAILCMSQKPHIGCTNICSSMTSHCPFIHSLIWNENDY